MPRVFMFAPTGNSYEYLEAQGCEVVLGKPGWHEAAAENEAQMIEAARGAHALAGTSIRATPISRAILEASPDLRIVAKATVGVDEIDVDACTELGILVTHAPVESNWGNIAETTVMFLLSLLKGQNSQDEHIKNGGWWIAGSQGRYVGSRRSDGYEGITLGIIGLGRIGARVAHLMRPWNIRILAYDPYIQDYRFLESEATPVDLETLLRESDVVTLHVTLNKKTRHMMSTPQFELMKPSAYFINTSRGEAVDEQALVDALERNVIAGVGLNAFEYEPLPANSPLRTMGNRVILRPHGGTVPTAPGMQTVGRTVGQNTEWVNADVLKALQGELPVHIFNPEAIPLWLERFGGIPVPEAPMITP